MLDEILDELFGPGFKAALLYHLKKRISVESLGDVIKASINDPVGLYRALADVLGGETGADILVASISRVMIRKLGIKASPREAVQSLKNGDKETVAKILEYIDTRIRRTLEEVRGT